MRLSSVKLRVAIINGAKFGLFSGVCLSAIALALFAISLGAVLNHSVVLLGAVILVYITAGVIAGIFISLLLPLVKWAIGAAVVGACAVIPLYGGIMIAVEGPRNLTWADAQGFLTLAGVIGAISGVLLRYRLIKRGLYQPD